MVREDRLTHDTAFDQAYLRNKEERFGTKYRQKKVVGGKRKEISRAAPVDCNKAFLCEDISDNEHTGIFGLASSEEMCIAYL